MATGGSEFLQGVSHGIPANARGSWSQSVRPGTRQKEMSGSLGATGREGQILAGAVDAVTGTQCYRSAVLRCDLKQGKIGSSIAIVFCNCVCPCFFSQFQTCATLQPPTSHGGLSVVAKESSYPRAARR